MSKSTTKLSAVAATATIYDVAREAGVSTGTVSRVFNNHRAVGDKTRGRVLEVARSMGMRPRTSVRRKQIALVTEPPSKTVMGGYVSSLMQYIAFELGHRGMNLVMVTEDRLEDLPSQFVDGVLAVAWRPGTIQMLDRMRHIPVVFINRFDLSDRFHTVGTDHREAGRQVADYLIERGHRRLALINHKSGPSSDARREGYAQAMIDAGLEVDERLMMEMDDHARLPAYLHRVVTWEADAVYLPTEDMIALEGLQILQAMMGVKVPEQLSVVGAENPGISSHTYPALTTLVQPLEAMATRAIELLLEQIDEPSNEPVQITLPMRLIERESVAQRTCQGA